MAPPFIKYIANTQHYDDVLAHVASVKNTLWIGTADIKDVYVKSGTTSVPLLAVFDKLVKRNVAIRLIHAKEPGPVFRKEHEKFPALWSSMEMALCPRVHFKLIIFDMETAYIGSANLTGAGIGMKSGQKRNFEAGILTNEPSLVEAAINQFDEVWRGKFCEKCGRRNYCNDQIL
ncbi:phospholipase D-like domain-containing protein [Marseilla massiliensis]|uniref:Phospholipase n=1 Tax=Marseilla massiliensis TaxID=1841864 RepID=A0A939B8G3_9BACT|nr:phospholipase D-like domain-containing protein [Marseilla massiliensis]MBM6674368.1 phospholipase [Marseilla massiliensis]